MPSEIRDGVVTSRDGRNVDAEFRAGAVKCLEIARREQPDLIVLQSRSPSCGVKQRYDGTFTGTLVDGAGVTAQLLIENGFRCVDVEDLATIHNGVLIRKLYSKEVRPQSAADICTVSCARMAGSISAEKQLLWGLLI